MGRILIVIALLTIGFVALGTGLQALNANKTHTLVMGVGGKGSDSYAIGKAISALATAHDPKLKIIVAETSGSEQNNKMMHEGHLQLAAELADTQIGSQTRLITRLYPDAYQLLVNNDANIKSVADLRGKRIALADPASGQYRSFFFLTRHFGLSKAEMDITTMSNQAAAWALTSGAVDALFRVRSPGNAELSNILANGNINIVPIRQSEALRLSKPAIQPGILPAGSYRGNPILPAENLPVPMVDRVLVANANVSDDVIERVTRLIYDYQREMSDYTPLAGFIARPIDLEQSAIPLHGGTRQFFDRDEPSYLQENAEVLAFYATLVAGLISLLLNLNNRRRKERVDAYNRELVNIYNSVVDDEAPQQAFYRNRMMDVFARIIRDHESGQVTSQGFDFLSFAWDELNDAVIDIVAEKNGTSSNRARRSGSDVLSEANDHMEPST